MLEEEVERRMASMAREVAGQNRVGKTWRVLRTTLLATERATQRRFVTEVKDAAAALAKFAVSGQVVPEFADSTIRELLIRPYRVVYKIVDDKVLVLALIHAAKRRWRI
jgi:plasmid stabilization system protein ParE